MDIHDVLEAGKKSVRDKAGNKINFKTIVFEVKGNLFSTHIRNVGKNRISNDDLITAAEYDKSRVIEMEQTILMMRKKLVITNEQKIKIDAFQAKEDSRYKSALLLLDYLTIDG